MSTESEPGRQPTEDELRAAYEAQIKQVKVEHVLLEHVVTLANLGLRRTGLAPGTEDERDPEQVRIAIDSIRAQLPLLEQSMPEQAAQIRDALSQLQFAFVKIGGAPEDAGAGGPAGPGRGGSAEPGGAGPAGAGGGGSAEPGGGGPAGPDEAPGEQRDPARPSEPQQPTPDEPGPAQRSGRLWVPGQ